MTAGAVVRSGPDSTQMTVPGIAIDLGGTIEDSWGSKRSWFAAQGFDLGRWPRSRREVIDQINGDEALYERMAAEVYNDANVRCRRPVAGVRRVCSNLSRRFRIFILTSRTDAQRALTRSWLRRHGLIDQVSEIVFLGPSGSKLAWCQAGNMSALVDDDIRHLGPTEEARGVKRVLFCASPHKPQPPCEHICVAVSWVEIQAILQACFNALAAE